MRITPIEIQQQRFKSRLFGYDTTAVDQFLEMLADELEQLYHQNNELKESLARTRTSLEQMREREKLLQQTLVTAQKMTEELKDQARRDAEIVIAEAHIEGERVLRDANERRIQLVGEIQEIKRVRHSFRNSLRAMIENHQQLLDMDIGTLQIDLQQHPEELQVLFADGITDDELPD
ncbi:MAG TPA: DivIVA domain-containing protein [Pelovirga sp.]|nr:DivIVA domain-containing protein [Pelovirga sp.]